MPYIENCKNINCKYHWFQYDMFDDNIVWIKCYMCRTKWCLISKYLVVALKLKYNKLPL